MMLCVVALRFGGRRDSLSDDDDDDDDELRALLGEIFTFILPNFGAPMMALGRHERNVLPARVAVNVAVDGREPAVANTRRHRRENMAAAGRVLQMRSCGLVASDSR